MAEHFDYQKAFIRNIGWLTPGEQDLLRYKKVAIAGLGGVGGVHLLTLARLGIERFHIADIDVFELQNFNRQVGATLNTINQPKVDVLEKMAKEINPNIEITIFPNGINNDNIGEFLEGVDLYVDGLDFFILDIRAQVFKQAYESNIPAITAGPLGMGTTYLIFMPNQMSFEQYFRFEKVPSNELPVQFLIGLNPQLFNRHYLVVPSSVNFHLEKGPSTIMACQLCAGVMGVEALKILLKRGPLYAAPRYHVFDAYLCKYKVGWIPWGNYNPIQQLKMYIMKKRLHAYSEEKIIPLPNEAQTVIEQILEYARWSPSGDNSQPWRFEIVDEHRVIVHVKNEAPFNCYDYNGIPTLISCGFLLETISISSSLFSLVMEHQYKPINNDQSEIHLIFKPDQTQKTNPLAYYIKERSVDRRHYKRVALTQKTKNHLAEAVGDEFAIKWFDSLNDRLRIAQLNAMATKIRMSMPELFQVHQKVFVSGSHAEEGIPIDAVGMNYITKHLMKWALKSSSRIQLMNRMGAITSSQLELDLLPGIFSGSNFMLVDKLKTSPITPDEYHLRVGRAMQRFWLTATKLGLVVQPNLAPLIFCFYANNKINFTQNIKLMDLALKLSKKMAIIDQGNSVLFLGRIGSPKRPKPASRSVRKPINELIITK